MSSEAAISTDLAVIYSETNLHDKAEKYYRQVLASEPDDPDRLNNLAYFLIDKNRNIEEDCN